MNKNVLIVLAGGFIIAILVAVLVQASLGGKKKTDDDAPRTQVLVAAKDLPLGKELEAGDLKWQTWPGSAFSGAIVREEDMKAEEALKGKLIQRVAVGQPVLSSYTFKEGRGNVVAATLEPGMRAVAIPVKATTMAGGFITPGDRVDVILTYRVDVGRGAEEEVTALVRNHASETILKNVRVVAVDQEASTEQEKAKVAKTVTIAVDTKGAQKVALASEMGDLTLSLRGIGDEAEDNTASVTTDMDVSRTMQNVARLRSGGSTGGPVRIYSGSSVEEVRPRGSAVTLYGNDNSEVEETTPETNGVITQ